MTVLLGTTALKWYAGRMWLACDGRGVGGASGQQTLEGLDVSTDRAERNGRMDDVGDGVQGEVLPADG